MSKALSAIKNGIIDENPTFIQVLGTCPTLAVTTSAINGIGMGLSTMAVLVCSNLFISLLNKIRTMRGCLTTIVFLLITSGLSTFMFGSAFFIAVLLDPDAPSIFELQWHTNVILLVYLIVFIKIIVKVSRMLSNSICDFLFGKEDEQ